MKQPMTETSHRHQRQLVAVTDTVPPGLENHGFDALGPLGQQVFDFDAFVEAGFQAGIEYCQLSAQARDQFGLLAQSGSPGRRVSTS